MKRLLDSTPAAITLVMAFIVVIWYGAAVYLNSDVLIDKYERQKTEWNFQLLVSDSWSMGRPVLPAPHQIMKDMNKSLFEYKITSKRSLVYHGWVTISSTLVGFVMGGVLGILLAIGIVHVPTLNKSVLPWIIASQTIPILAVAPMIIVVLNAVGISGLLPKAIISMYLSFFPVVVGMVKGLRSPDHMQLDQMRTWNAGGGQTLWYLRLPSSMPYLFTSLKIAMAASLVGAVVGELPTGAVAGLGARLLAGSYYGQTIQIWSALIMAAMLAALLVGLIGVLQRITLKHMGMV